MSFPTALESNEISQDIDKDNVHRNFEIIKDKVKEAVKFITSFERQLAYQAKIRGCNSVICGHIHTPEDKNVDGVRYLNCGDWIENNSYITYNKGKYNVHKFKG
jgi:UDP-2,3-diacylglucosamine pyrophosphatase LpxH